jgi:hypothetical protein
MGGIKMRSCLKSLLGVLAIFALSAAANAQTYTVTSTTGNSIVPGTTDIGNHCDDCATAISLPFPVLFYGVPYTSVSLDSNGTVQFTTTTSVFTNTALPTPDFGPTMFPYWDDLYTVFSGFGIFTVTEGVAPNRIFDIEWRDQYFPGTGTAHFEVRLYENQTYFDFVYGLLTGGSDSATVGVQNDPFAPTPDFTQYSFDTSGTLTDGQDLRFDVGATSVPEPTSMSLIALGGLALFGLRRSKRSKQA